MYVKIQFKHGTDAVFGIIADISKLDESRVKVKDAVTQRSFVFMSPQGPVGGTQYEWHVTEDPNSCVRDVLVPRDEIKAVVILEEGDWERVQQSVRKIRESASTGPGHIVPATLVPGPPIPGAGGFRR